MVLDAGGFPPVRARRSSTTTATGTDRGRFKAELTRKVDFAGNPMGFAEDVEVLPNGEYVVSESVFGGLWLIGRDGEIRAAAWCPTSARRAAAQARPVPVPGRRHRLHGRRRSPSQAAGELRPRRRLARRPRHAICT